MITPISRDELALKLRLGAPLKLIEALGSDWYADAHLPGALNIPPSHVEHIAPGVLADPNEPIVVYASRTCGDAAAVAATLASLGYGRVQVYVDGKEDWIEAGLPVERGP